MQRLEGMAALVTGGGRGIGRAVALAFAREGARVAVAARTQDEIEAVARECGGDAIAIPLDVSDEQACNRAVETARAELGRLDLLVNNAGIASSHKFTEMDTATWRRILAVDLEGPFFLTRAALPGELVRPPLERVPKPVMVPLLFKSVPLVSSVPPLRKTVPVSGTPFS